MDTTVDTFVNQAATLFLNKLDQQNIDPNFLQKFLDSLLNKFVYKTSNTIKQQPASTTDKGSVGLVNDIKKVYKDLLKDASYKTEYKKFLKDVLPTDLFIKPDNVPSTSTQTSSTSVQVVKEETEEGRANLIQEKKETQKVIFDGFSDKGWQYFSERLPKILKNIFPKPTEQKPGTGSGIGLFGAGIAALLGGLAALVAGLMTDGPFKGILKILSTVGLKGAIKLLEAGAKAFLASLKSLLNAPLALLDDVTKAIGKIFGKEAFKAVVKPIRAISGLFTKMLGGLVKFITPLLKKLPLIGTVISWGFAYSRFKSGDVIGGTIDVLSGIASIFPGVGTAIAIGLDVLNAFLDVKAGGANEKASQKKTGILKDWALGLGNLVWEGAKKAPIIGPLIDTINSLQQGNWFDALYNFARINPLMDPIVGLIEYFTDTNVKESVQGGTNNIAESIQGLFTWIKESIWDKVTGFIGSVIDGVKDWWNNLSWDPRSWIGIETKDIKPDITSANKTQKDSQTDITANQPKPMKDGGLVTKPINAIVGEAGPEMVLPLTKSISNDLQSGTVPAGDGTVPLNKVLGNSDISLNNSALKQIVDNTKNTNNALKAFGEALYGLVKVLDKKLTSNNGGTTIINTQGGSKQIPSASQVANSNVDVIRNIREKFRQVQFE